MADLSTGEQYALATGIVLTAVLLVVAFYAMRHLRRRRERLREKREDDPAVASDRAFNRLAMARTEADLLERQGVDVAQARQLIGLAESSFGTRQFNRAFDLAQSAHNTLVAARKAPKSAPPAQPPAPATPSPAAAPFRPTVPLPAAGPNDRDLPAPTVSKVPKNRAESHFELGLLERDLETARRERPKQSGTKKGEATRVEAQAAYDRADYTEAFRLALKGRREVGGRVETLAPGPVRAVDASSKGAEAPLTSDTPAQVAETVAAAERCPQCGHPTQSSDAFCRGCGTPRVPATCPKCGAPRLATDSFCGTCGQKYG
jgi:hypothetical protein